jgi:hypothetical protein
MSISSGVGPIQCDCHSIAILAAGMYVGDVDQFRHYTTLLRALVIRIRATWYRVPNYREYLKDTITLRLLLDFRWLLRLDLT